MYEEYLKIKNKFFIVFFVLLSISPISVQAQFPTNFYRIVIPNLKLERSSGIIVSEKVMTKLIFNKLGNLPKFRVDFVAPENFNQDDKTIDILVEGKYELDESIITIDYNIQIPRRRTSLVRRIDKSELETVQNTVSREISTLLSTVTVETEPAGVMLSLDSVEIGVTPITLNNVLIGQYALNLKLEDHLEINENINIDPSNPNKFNYTLDEIIYDLFLLTEQPEPVDGIRSISEKINYRSFRSLDGSVIVKVTIDKEGKVASTEILKNIGGGAGKAVEKAVRSVNWKPGKINGRPVKSRIVIPISFKYN